MSFTETRQSSYHSSHQPRQY